MGNYSNYTLLLGVKLGLEERVIETNPKWKGIDDKDTPQYVLSGISEDEYFDMRDTVVKDERYAHGEKEIGRGHIFPNGQITQNLTENGTFAYDHDCDIGRLCFIEDESWLGVDVQLLGVALLHHSTSDGYREGDEQKVLTALGQKNKLAEMINKYGFKFKPEEISLHQYIMVEG